jgi:hypothetical protein
LCDAAFAENLLREGVYTMLAGDIDTGKVGPGFGRLQP